VLVEVCDGYRYNEEPPEGTFDLPAGKRLVTPDPVPASPDITGTLPAEERAELVRLISASEAGWEAGDFRAFAKAWKFKDARSKRPLPSREEWRERVEAQKGRRADWASRIVSVEQADYFPVTTGPNACTGVRMPGVLQVRTSLHVRGAAGGPEWEGEARFFVQRGKTGFRIVHWEAPVEEIREATRAKP